MIGIVGISDPVSACEDSVQTQNHTIKQPVTNQNRSERRIQCILYIMHFWYFAYLTCLSFQKEYWAHFQIVCLQSTKYVF